MKKELEELKQTTAAISDDGPLVWCDVLSGDTHGIPGHSYIIAATDGGDLEIAIENGYLTIRCQNGYPVIQAQAANVIRVTVQEMW